MVSSRSLSHYSTPQDGATSVDGHFTPPGGWATVPGGSLGLSSTTLPTAQTFGSTAASILAPIRVVVGSVFASSGAITQTVKPTSSLSKTKLNNIEDKSAKSEDNRGSGGGDTRPQGEDSGGGGKKDGGEENVDDNATRDTYGKRGQG